MKKFLIILLIAAVIALIFYRTKIYAPKVKVIKVDPKNKKVDIIFMGQTYTSDWNILNNPNAGKQVIGDPNGFHILPQSQFDNGKDGIAFPTYNGKGQARGYGDIVKAWF